MPKPDPRLVKRLLAVMPNQSTIDLQTHAEHVALAVAHGRQVHSSLRRKARG